MSITHSKYNGFMQNLKKKKNWKTNTCEAQNLCGLTLDLRSQVV